MISENSYFTNLMRGIGCNNENNYEYYLLNSWVNLKIIKKKKYVTLYLNII